MRNHDNRKSDMNFYKFPCIYSAIRIQIGLYAGTINGLPYFPLSSTETPTSIGGECWNNGFISTLTITQVLTAVNHHDFGLTRYDLLTFL